MALYTSLCSEGLFRYSFPSAKFLEHHKFVWIQIEYNQSKLQKSVQEKTSFATRFIIMSFTQPKIWTSIRTDPWVFYFVFHLFIFIFHWQHTVLWKERERSIKKEDKGSPRVQDSKANQGLRLQITNCSPSLEINPVKWRKTEALKDYKHYTLFPDSLVSKLSLQTLAFCFNHVTQKIKNLAQFHQSLDFLLHWKPFFSLQSIECNYERDWEQLLKNRD